MNELPPTRDAWLEYVLQNWGTWARCHAGVGPEEPTKCGSAERHYDAPVWDTDEPPPPPPDDLLGEKVERAWRVIPITQRRVLKICYVELPLKDARVKVKDADGNVVEGQTEPMPDEVKDRIRASEAGLFEKDYQRVLKEGRQSIWLAMQGRVVVEGWVQPQRAL